MEVAVLTPARGRPVFAFWPTSATAIGGYFIFGLGSAALAWGFYFFVYAGSGFFDTTPLRSAFTGGYWSIVALSSATLAELCAIGFLLWRLPAISALSLRELGFRRPAARDMLWVPAALAAITMAYIANDRFLSAIRQGHHVARMFAGWHGFTSPLQAGLTFIVLLVAPFFEELLARVLILNAVRSWSNTSVAVLVSSLIFGSLHFDLVLLPVFTLIGAILGLLYVRTRNFYVCYATHAVVDITLVFYAALWYATHR